jgi:hypothetical protein
MMSATDKTSNRQHRWLALVGLAYLFALFTAFVAVATGAQAWVEFRHGQWPATSAHIERCDLKPYQSSTGRRLEHSAYYIACDISFETTQGQSVRTTIRSRRVASPEYTVPDTGPRIGQMQSWVDQHPPGTVLAVHYDPSDQRHVVLSGTDMPEAGPQTANNVRLLVVCATACGLLSLIARVLRPLETRNLAGR